MGLTSVDISTSVSKTPRSQGDKNRQDSTRDIEKRINVTNAQLERLMTGASPRAKPPRLFCQPGTLLRLLRPGWCDAEKPLDCVLVGRAPFGGSRSGNCSFDAVVQSAVNELGERVGRARMRWPARVGLATTLGNAWSAARTNEFDAR
jgi:hypothetical protein